MPDRDPLTADQVEQIGRLLTPGVKEIVRAELHQILDAVRAVEGRVARLERNQGKALAGFGFLASVVSAAATWAWQYVKGRFLKSNS